jgi:hypothetical protein
MSKQPSTPRESPEPMEGNDVAVVAAGTIVWAVLFVVQLPFYGWYHRHGHTWFIWSCAVGAVLGLYGLWYVRARRDAIARGRAEAAASGDATA